MYEYAITFPYELQLFWGRKVTGAMLLFFANRYLALFFWIFDSSVVGPVSSSVSPCTLSNYADDTDTMHPKTCVLVLENGEH